MPFKRIWKCRLKTVVCVLTFRHLSGKILSLFNKRGPVAQLGARLNRTEEARGSNPLRSTGGRGTLRQLYKQVIYFGPIAQLGARLNGIEEAGGSNPPGSTRQNW